MSFGSFVHMAMKTCRKGGVGKGDICWVMCALRHTIIPFSEDLCLCFSGNPQPQSMSGGGGGGGGFSSFGLGGKPIGDVTANPFGSTLGGPQGTYQYNGNH